MRDKPYEIWICNLNDLYLNLTEHQLKHMDELVTDCSTIDEARVIKNDHVTHDQAAWIIRRDTREVVQ